MKKISSKLLGGVLLFSLSMSLTSCEGALDDILGEWSRPASIKEGTFSYATTSQVIGITVDDFVNPITIEGDGKVTYSSSDPTIAEVDPETGVITPHKFGTVTITATITDGKKYAYETKEISYTLKVSCPYMKWDDTTQKLVEADPLDETTASIMPAESELADAPANSKLLPAGTYIIAEDMTFNKNIQLSGDVDIILCDGKTLTFNMFLYGNDGSNSYKLNIYGQSEDTGKLIVSYGILGAKPLNVYGGQIDLTVSGDALREIDGMNVYGGKVNAVCNSSNGGSGIKMKYGATLTIYGGEVFAKGPATETNQSGYGIGGNANVVVNGGSLVAISQRNYVDSDGIWGNLTVNGGSVEVKDVNKTTGGISGDSRAAVSGTITVGAGVSLQGKNHNTGWADITDNTNTYQHIRTKQ